MLIRKIGLLICIWSAGTVCLAQLNQCQTPAWKYEVASELTNHRKERLSPAMLLSMDRSGVVFIDDDRLMMYSLEPSGKLSSRTSHETSSAFQLRLKIFDAQSGELKLSRDVNTRPFGASVQVTAGGILVNTGKL